jgi:hypothetical protein
MRIGADFGEHDAIGAAEIDAEVLDASGDVDEIPRPVVDRLKCWPDKRRPLPFNDDQHHFVLLMQVRPSHLVGGHDDQAGGNVRAIHGFLGEHVTESLRLGANLDRRLIW